MLSKNNSEKPSFAIVSVKIKSTVDCFLFHLAIGFPVDLKLKSL